MKIPVANLGLCCAHESVYVHLEISDPDTDILAMKARASLQKRVNVEQTVEVSLYSILPVKHVQKTNKIIK